VRQTTTPNQPDVSGLERSGAALVTLFGLARDGKVDKNGLPNLLQLAVLVRSMMPYAYLDGMPTVCRNWYSAGLPVSAARSATGQVIRGTAARSQARFSSRRIM
jgi:hypothetical protein